MVIVTNMIKTVIVVLIVLPTEDDRHKLDKDGDSDVCRADVGDQEVGRLGEQAVAVLDGGQDDHVEDGGEEAEGHLDEDIHTACCHLRMKALKHQLGKQCLLNILPSQAQQ